MRKHIHRPFINIVLITLTLSQSNTSSALPDSKYLSVISSANTESNYFRSFVIINKDELLPEGIKSTTTQQHLGKQTPFVIQYTKELKQNINLQWIIKASNKKHGTIKLISDFKGRGKIQKSAYLWESEILDKSIADRHQLVFRPNPFQHLPVKYNKGRDAEGKRNRYGGGTLDINKPKYNPRYAYDITLHIFRGKKRIFTHKTHLQMDNKDMIRQEYINHYNIKHFTEKDIGIIPVPMRNEISDIPEMPENMEGNPLTESDYDLIINDGMLELSNNINIFYLKSLKSIRSKGGIVDLNKSRRKVPDIKLWISSGWRNPERNEWYSNTLNGNHQIGGAVDIVIMAPANSLESSLGYWILWKSLTKFKKQINGYWQLESNGIPMKNSEYWQDIEPKNGIPDAFDKADHLHANVNY